jgi:RNA polymerase sigma-70 factor (ECF subfamily)
MTNNNFEDIYNKFQPAIHRLCLGYFGGNLALASDTCQEIFIKVWQNLERFKEQSKVSTWIYRIAVNTCINVLRSAKHKHQNAELSINQMSETLEEKQDDKDASQTDLQLKAMYRCISSLKPKDRSIILLVLDQEPYKQIAEIIGISENNLRVKIHRIKDKLSKCVNS